MLERHHPDPADRLGSWARGFIRSNPTNASALLADLNSGVAAWISNRREAPRCPRVLRVGHIRARNPQILSPWACTPLPIARPFSKPHPRQEPWWFPPNERLESLLKWMKF